ncbi:MAG: respiratory nitrate reductase subunit gamma [Terriglobales bacterium]
MTAAVYLSIYAGVLLFVVGCVVRIVRYARTPVHLRWELYPVPHEEPRRAAHGGSYFEDLNWWTRPRHVNRGSELRAMASEIGFLKALWESNRGLWYSSFLFHVGLYLTFAVFLLTVARAFAPASLSFLRTIQLIAGYFALATTLAGALGLLVRRLTDPEMKNYTAPADLVNLHLFIIVYGLLAAGFLARPAQAASLPELLRGLLAFDSSVVVGRGFGAGLILASALLAYIPFTHMAHFIAKYFTYHAVRWDDRANTRGSSLESAVAPYLTYQPTWSAPHIAGDGRKTWAEVATTNPVAEVRK